mmetsp:Transcript_41262/g.105069  ORF Transcript_41262/g.105069 Transcript_41262/m.105069 type:complete len:252 (+) Transcript_41262:718-1473(+)
MMPWLPPRRRCSWRGSAATAGARWQRCACWRGCSCSRRGPEQPVSWPRRPWRCAGRPAPDGTRAAPPIRWCRRCSIVATSKRQCRSPSPALRPCREATTNVARPRLDGPCRAQWPPSTTSSPRWTRPSRRSSSSPPWAIAGPRPPPCSRARSCRPRPRTAAGLLTRRRLPRVSPRACRTRRGRRWRSTHRSSHRSFAKTTTPRWSVRRRRASSSRTLARGGGTLGRCGLLARHMPGWRTTAPQSTRQRRPA